MKTLQLLIIILLTSGVLVYTTNSVYAPCLVGVVNCGPPPSVKVSIGTDNQFYEKNDTINVQGQVYVQNYSKSIHVQVINSDNATIQSIDTPVVNGKFGLKIRANFDMTGSYQIVTCVQGWCDASFFKFIGEPYKLTVSGQDFFIKYKSFADLTGVDADINNHALRVHITNATAQGLQFVIELPRALIDSIEYDKDASFNVLIGEHQPDKYMQPTNFTEIASNDLSRTIAIDIPYEPVSNAQGVWDFKISSVETASGKAASEPPLKQFKSGIAAKNITCNQNLELIFKSENGSPACVKPDTATKLIERGWAKSPENTGVLVTLTEGQREDPLLVQKILSDSIHGLDFREYPLATNVGNPITLHIGDSVSNGCTVELTLVKISNGTAVFLKKENFTRVCPICLSENTVIDTPTSPSMSRI